MIFIHVSELAIDRLLAGEVAPADASAMRDHAANCDRCGVLLADALAAQTAFAADRPPLRLPAAAPMVKRRTAVAAMATTAALAAGVVGVLAWPHTAQEQQPEHLVRTKGAAIVGYYVSSHGVIRRGAAHEQVAAGDHVQLFTSTTEDAWFAAISIDGHGTRSVYVPAQRVAAATDHTFGMSIELDDTLGDETVTGVFCAAPFVAEAIDPAHPPAGCTTDHFVLTKAVR